MVRSCSAEQQMQSGRTDTFLDASHPDSMPVQLSSVTRLKHIWHDHHLQAWLAVSA